jgi:hypothetical protein
MRAGSLPSFVGLALALASATAACTVFSGVDDMELRSASSPASAAPDADGGTDGATAQRSDAPANEATPPGTSSGTAPSPSTGPVACGSQGSWTGCDVTATITTCAIECAAKGFTCVDSCCATDELGDFSAKVGMVYALASECSVPSMPSNASFGLCADPSILPTGLGQIRCCCK